MLRPASALRWSRSEARFVDTISTHELRVGLGNLRGLGRERGEGARAAADSGDVRGTSGGAWASGEGCCGLCRVNIMGRGERRNDHAAGARRAARSRRCLRMLGRRDAPGGVGRARKRDRAAGAQRRRRCMQRRLRAAVAVRDAGEENRHRHGCGNPPQRARCATAPAVRSANLRGPGRAFSSAVQAPRRLQARRSTS